MRTARGNAWEAVCADRARADQRAELDRLVAELAATRAAARDRRERQTGYGWNRPADAPRSRSATVGSSPRSSASHAAAGRPGRRPAGPAAAGGSGRAGRS